MAVGCGAGEVAVGGEGASVEEVGADQAVLVYLFPGEEVLSLDLLEEPLIEAIEGSGAGEFDGNSISLDGEQVVLYMYGPDADSLFAAISGVLREVDVPPGSYAIKRFGGPGSREERVDLNE